MAIRPRYMILLVIISNNILLSLLITLTYYLFLPDYIPNILNLIYLLLRISLFYCITKMHQPTIAFLKNVLAYNRIVVLLSTHQHLIY